jgi:hypothetical protein
MPLDNLEKIIKYIKKTNISVLVKLKTARNKTYKSKESLVNKMQEK